MMLLLFLPRPIAIFAGNDMIALGVLTAIRGAGLRCSEDVSVIGFDDLESARPQTLRCPLYPSPDISSRPRQPAYC